MNSNTMNPESYESFTVTTDVRGVTTAQIDVPDRPLNVFNATVMRELDQVLQDLEKDADCQAVIFRSAKESGFMAGADVKLIFEIESPAQAMQLIELGQRLFDRIQWLPMPTVAVIHGPCLGGGLEWALACDYRIARNSSSTKIGLPEIKLGLIPGWGGTQRLPRLVGTTTALQMIMQGKQFSTKEALKIGLIDLSVQPDEWHEKIDNFVSRVLAGTKFAKQRAKRPFWKWLAESTRIGRKAIFAATEKRIAPRVENYPALESALKAVRASYGLRPDGLIVERSEFVDLLATPTCRNLLQVFFARESARAISTWSGEHQSAFHDEPIRKIAVIGAGAMGAGIGQLAACRSVEVVLKEIDEAAAQAGRKRIDSLMSKLAKRGTMTENELSQIANRIEVTTDENSLKDVDLVVEAVVERIDVKRKVFESLERFTSPQTLLTTNTSSLSVGRMADATLRPLMVAGLHFFNPVHKMELVEVVRAAETSDATIARLVGFVRALGKTPIVTADSPGFLVNRVLFPYLGEAVLMVAQGHAVEQLDKQIRRFGMPMGPLELLDQVGLDVALHVARSLDGVLKGVEPVAEQLGLMVDRNMLGSKTGNGFYRYRKGRRDGVSDIPRMDPVAAEIQSPSDHEHLMPFREDGLTPVQRRLIYPMLAEAIRCKEEAVVEENWAIDLAMVLGTGFAPHRGGPLRVVDAITQRVVLENLERLHDIHGERFAAPKLLFEMADAGLTFFGAQNAATTSHAVTSS